MAWLRHWAGNATGVRIFDYSNVEVMNNIIRDNQTSYEGAGVQVQRYSQGYIHDNSFLYNSSLHSCAISVIVGSSATISDNLFRGNVSTFLSAGIGLNNSLTEITGNVFIENHSVHGATIHAVHSSTHTNIHHNSFIFNYGTSDGGSGIYVYSGATMIASNNIFAFNDGTPAILNNGGSLELHCNDIWQNDINYYGIPNPIGINGNIYEDPMICDPLRDNAALSEYSPCLFATCGIMGANPVPECSTAIPIETQSWGQVKAFYR